MFQALLERRSEIGQQGEQVALQFEMARLRRMGCPDPERHVQLVAQAMWAGATTFTPPMGKSAALKSKVPLPAATLYLSENERQVLTTLGDKAWLYRVAACRWMHRRRTRRTKPHVLSGSASGTSGIPHRRTLAHALKLRGAARCIAAKAYCTSLSSKNVHKPKAANRQPLACSYASFLRLKPGPRLAQIVPL